MIWAVIHALLFLSVVLLAAGAHRTPRSLAVETTGELPEISADRFLPMADMLKLDDILLRRTQPGFTRRAEAALRRERSDAFEKHLSELCGDFRHGLVALKVRLMNSEQDRPDLATALARRQGKFAWGLMAVQFRLFVYRRGAILWTKPAIG